ncbi:hypothetical protein GJ744_003482 [Endocarpon pusillum]|uniref:DUF7730 domain-containing protein n=1 Tax=Endocarpon pusillum TaxID=364733 RepID=A0A8H7E9I4_9EURO|nr:hypothetical protein GJ744_003482 [Endocarpon pusillum]
MLYWLYRQILLSEPAIPPRLPILAPKRQHVLTPSPSHDNLHATAKSAFFQQLPLELRRHIYIAAFGKRTIHMDLRFDYPEPPGLRHARLKGDCMHERERSELARWRWWSSVCHRNPLLECWLDQCRTGENNATCFLFPGEWPDKCFLGVMGWLLACRQAYLEGLDVLYSTNTVHLSSIVLTRHLPLLILPQRLVSITSLELLWDLVLFRPLPDHQADQETGWPAYQALVLVVASAFPNLRKLHISIQTGSYVAKPFAEYIESHERKLLDPIDEMVRKIGPQLQDCQIALPYSLHTALLPRAESVGARVESGGRGALSWRQFWRSVTAEQDEQSQSDLGYWVRRGVDDMPLTCS